MASTTSQSSATANKGRWDCASSVRQICDPNTSTKTWKKKGTGACRIGQLPVPSDDSLVLHSPDLNMDVSLDFMSTRRKIIIRKKNGCVKWNSQVRIRYQLFQVKYICKGELCFIFVHAWLLTCTMRLNLRIWTPIMNKIKAVHSCMPDNPLPDLLLKAEVTWINSVLDGFSSDFWLHVIIFSKS